jgi:hypothetical protein
MVDIVEKNRPRLASARPLYVLPSGKLEAKVAQERSRLQLEYSLISYLPES